MRDDLLDARAAVDWAASQTVVLTRRIHRWVQSSPYLAVIEPDSDPGYEIIKAKLSGEPLPLVINAEAGAIINMIRSGLDILAFALAERHGNVKPKNVYFPICASASGFHRAIKQISWLSETDRLRVKEIKPDKGGDNLLFALHHLDIVRKHRRLLAAGPAARSFGVFRWGADHAKPEILYPGKLEDGTRLMRIASGADAQPQLRLEVRFAEPPFGNMGPIGGTLRTFAARASEVIEMFDA